MRGQRGARGATQLAPGRRDLVCPAAGRGRGKRSHCVVSGGGRSGRYDGGERGARRGMAGWISVHEGSSRGGDLGRLGRVPDPDLGAALATARAWAPGWRTLILNMPRPSDSEVRVEVQRGRAGQPHRTGFLTLDAASGAVLAWESGVLRRRYARTAREQFLRYAHRGEYRGLGGQLLAELFSLAAALMVWTGLSLAVRWLRRFVSFRRGLRR